MNILKEYLIQILIVATILVVIYLFRNKILGAITGGLTGETLDQYKADLSTIENTDASTLIKDSIASLEASLPGGYISQEQFRANIAQIQAQLALQKAQ